MGGTGNNKADDTDPAEAELGSQAAEDFAVSHYGTAKGYQILDSDGDGVPDYRDDAPNDPGSDADGDDDDDDDDADSTAQSLWDIENENDDVLNNNDYNNLDSGNCRFHQCFDKATTQERTAFIDAKKAEQAAATGPKTADNFVALERARVEKSVAATAIIAAHGSGPDAQRAAEANPRLQEMDRKLEKLQTQLQGKTDAEKDAILAKAFPKEWARYEKGELQQNAARNGASYTSAQNDLPGGGVEQPFSVRLNQLFASAVSPPTPVTPAPTLAPVSPTVQPQAPAYT